MKYLDFDHKFNKRICEKIEKCSIIDMEGRVYASGTVSELEELWDKYTTPIWKNGNYDGCEVDGKKVIMTNLGETLFERIKVHFKFIM